MFIGEKVRKNYVVQCGGQLRNEVTITNKTASAVAVSSVICSDHDVNGVRKSSNFFVFDSLAPEYAG